MFDRVLNAPLLSFENPKQLFRGILQNSFLWKFQRKVKETLVWEPFPEKNGGLLKESHHIHIDGFQDIFTLFENSCLKEHLGAVSFGVTFYICQFLFWSPRYFKAWSPFIADHLIICRRPDNFNHFSRINFYLFLVRKDFVFPCFFIDTVWRSISWKQNLSDLALAI